MALARLRGLAERARRRLRPAAWPILQTAAAAGGAWFFAQLVSGHARPIFAPIAAVVAMTAGRGRRGSAAVQLILGIAFGIALATLLVRAIGMGPWQLVVVVALTMAAATALGLRDFMVTQSGVWAVIVVTGTQGRLGIAEDRLVDALIGGGVALVLAQLLFPTDPIEVLDEAARTTRAEIDRVLEELAAALRGHDEDRAREALRRADEIDTHRLADALAVGRDVARRAPRRRPARRRLDHYDDLARDLQQRARDARVLAVAGARLLGSGRTPPAHLAEAVERLAAGEHDPEVVSLAGRRAFDESDGRDEDPG